MQTNSSINTSVPFTPLKMLKEGGKSRLAVIIWLILSSILIPSSALTILNEWTGIELTLGSFTFYITIYIPMLICVPLVFWYGFFWAAIPAYFSTFFVAYLGGMPLLWIILFSFANLLTLAMYAMSYQVIKLRPTLGDFNSFFGFVLISFTASFAGSAGSFIWAYAKNVALSDALPRWQGWWFGGWLTAIFIILPLLHFAGPHIEKWMASLKSSNTRFANPNRNLAMATISFISILLGYAVAARFISIELFDDIKQLLPDGANIINVQNAIYGLSYPLYILLTVLLAVTFLVYRAIINWQQAIVDANEQLTEKNIELEKLATIDHLSKLFNRRKAFELAATEFKRSKRNDNHLSFLMIDIDHFKRFNDEYGHFVGDEVIQEVASRLQKTLRPYDSPGRYGGEEFIAILPDTELQNATQIAQRILSNIAENPVSTKKGNLDVSVSIGVTTLFAADIDATDVITRADQALLKAKNSGRNCIEVSAASNGDKV